MLLNAHRIDHVPLILLVMEDVTARTLAEKERQDLLEQSTEFMAVASHELKTPVSSLKGFTQMLQRRFTKVGEQEAAGLLATMEMQLDKLTALIGELLDVTRIEAGHLRWENEHLDLNALLREIVEEMVQTTTHHQIRIEGAVLTPVSGNPDRLGQVLTNLLSSAIKYAPQADTIVVKLRAGVQDFGIGIAQEKQAHVFDRFFRVSDPEHETSPGLGLGLYILAEIVKRHGGRMWVDSSPDAGSTFSFTIPFASLSASGTAQKAREEPHA